MGNKKQRQCGYPGAGVIWPRPVRDAEADRLAQLALDEEHRIRTPEDYRELFK